MISCFVGWNPCHDFEHAAYLTSSDLIRHCSSATILESVSTQAHCQAGQAIRSFLLLVQILHFAYSAGSYCGLELTDSNTRYCLDCFCFLNLSPFCSFGFGSLRRALCFRTLRVFGTCLSRMLSREVCPSFMLKRRRKCLGTCSFLEDWLRPVSHWSISCTSAFLVWCSCGCTVILDGSRSPWCFLSPFQMCCLLSTVTRRPFAGCWSPCRWCRRPCLSGSSVESSGSEGGCCAQNCRSCLPNSACTRLTGALVGLLPILVSLQKLLPTFVHGLMHGPPAFSASSVVFA